MSPLPPLSPAIPFALLLSSRGKRFLRRVSLTHFPSRSPFRGYVNLLTDGLYPHGARSITDSRMQMMSPDPPARSYTYKSARANVWYSLFLPVSLILPPLFPGTSPPACHRPTFLLYSPPAMRNASPLSPPVPPIPRRRNNRDT